MYNFMVFRLSKLLKRDDGYVAALTLLMLPVFLGATVFAIDGSRIVNLHTDLQNAADAMALAGARELDGRADAILRAREAISNLTPNNANFGGGTSAFSDLGTTRNIIFASNSPSTNSVIVEFYSDIPDDDQVSMNTLTPIAGTDADSARLAEYVRVVVQPQTINSIFPIGGAVTTNVSAEAVATQIASACDITPIFICNPVEPDPDAASDSVTIDGVEYTSFQDAFSRGLFYSREFRMVLNNSDNPGPGNFGFLRTTGNGANVLSNALATGQSGTCFGFEGVDSEPGIQIGPVESGINTRFGLYAGSFGNNSGDFAYRPDINVRRGQEQGDPTDPAPSCNNYEIENDTSLSIPLPTGNVIDDPAFSLVAGSTISSQQWDVATYWQTTYGETVPQAVLNTRRNVPTGVTDPANSLPNPSRFDVYNYEIDANNDGLIDTDPFFRQPSPGGETGTDQLAAGGPQCSTNASIDAQRIGRREIFAAVINCMELADEIQGAFVGLPAEAFVKMFLTRPAEVQNNDRFLNLEIIDISGSGGSGEVEDLLREESQLVR